MNNKAVESIVVTGKIYYKNDLIILADEARNTFNQALILFGIHKKIVSIHDFEQASNTIPH